MLDFPVFHHNIMKYWLCLDCVIRVFVRCKHAVGGCCGDARWCKFQTPMIPCNLTSDPTGYMGCPQIRTWEEDEVDWVKTQNREREKQLKLVPANSDNQK